VVTFVYRKDIAKAPETVVQSVMLQQQAQMTSVATLATELRRIEDRLNLVQRELAATQQGTDKAMGDIRTLVDDVTAVRKFMLQTAQLGWLNHELTLENATGIRRMAATSQELAASSAKLEDTVRQLSESLAGQLKELAARLDSIQGKIQNLH
jgi:chromosome segregation ATPase